MAVHVVKAGENLSAIASLYNVSVDAVVRVNGLQSKTSLVPGLALYIPDTLLPIRIYQLKEEESFLAMVQHFGTTVSLISSANPNVEITQLKTGQIINIPSPIKMKMRTLGFFVPSRSPKSLSILNKLGPQLSYVAIVNYSFSSQGYAYAGIDDSAVIKRCRKLKIKPLLMLRNFTSSGFSAELAGEVLESPVKRKNLVESIVNLTRKRGFDGASLDLEFVPPARRNDYNEFLRALKQGLGDLLLNVNVHAKTEDLPTNRIVGAYDYATIGSIADLMAVMTIDYGYPGGPPEPVSPINWVNQVFQYALSLVSPEKLQMGMALYGYDKVINTNATQALSVLAAQNKAIDLKVPIQFSHEAQSPWYRYKTSDAKEHIVWFEDIRSYIEKYKLIDIYKLAGATYWQISLPAPQNWAFINKEFTIVKK